MGNSSSLFKRQISDINRQIQRDLVQTWKNIDSCKIVTSPKRAEALLSGRFKSRSLFYVKEVIEPVDGSTYYKLYRRYTPEGSNELSAIFTEEGFYNNFDEIHERIDELEGL